ncbi:serine/threonine protein kinase [Nocardioides sp. BGMRC 2183]|nr:serine/threonine protein kinase [Nocardioides sp. BGMRC 2183]
MRRWGWTGHSGRDLDTSDAVPAGAEVLPGYEVVALLRRGNRIDTYDAFDRARDCRCVIKVLRPDRAEETHCREALLREGTLLRDLAHPHLVRVYEVVDDHRPAFVMETLTGATLDAVLEDGPLGPGDVVLLGRQLVSAIGYLHRHGWLHLDVKPSNVVVQDSRAVLIDLSLAARPGDGRPHAGTDGYLAPEQVTGRGLAAPTDVFGLGVTLGEALTGELPYGEEDSWRTGTAPRATHRRFRRGLVGVGSELRDLVLACIDPDPALRPSLADVRASLDSLTQTAG